MPGFLDSMAPSITAEYVRYINADILGKLIFKNFFVNSLGFSKAAIYVPLGRHNRYDDRKISNDAQVRISDRWINFEIKCSYINIAHPGRMRPLRCWTFARMLYTAANRLKKPFDIAFAIGIHARGLGDPEYWSESMGAASDKWSHRGPPEEVQPHEPEFLRRCGLFFVPYHFLHRNDLTVTIPSLPKSPYSRFFAWGGDLPRCKRLLGKALRTTRFRRSPDTQN
jgi:hypothetical protein